MRVNHGMGGNLLSYCYIGYINFYTRMVFLLVHAELEEEEI